MIGGEEEEEEEEEEIGNTPGISRSASAGRLNLVHQGCSKVHIARIFEATPPLFFFLSQFLSFIFFVNKVLACIVFLGPV
jgi:hypothetical protein